VTEEGIWTWAEFKAVMDGLLALPVSATEQLLVLTEFSDAYGGVSVEGHIVEPQDLARVENWKSVYSMPPGGWVDAKVVSLREITLREHIILVKLLYAHMASLVGSGTPPGPPTSE